MQIASYNIVRRAYSNRVIVDTIETTWTAAMLICMMMEAYNGDGEYYPRKVGEDVNPGPTPMCEVQRAFAYL